MEAKSSLSHLTLGLVGAVFNFLLRIRNMFVLIFTGVAHFVFSSTLHQSMVLKKQHEQQ